MNIMDLAAGTGKVGKELSSKGFKNIDAVGENQCFNICLEVVKLSINEICFQT